MGASSHASSYYHDALSFHVLLQVLYQLQLLVNGKPANDHLQDRTHADVVFSNKTAIIDVGEHAHEESRNDECLDEMHSGFRTNWQSMRSVIPP